MGYENLFSLFVLVLISFDFDQFKWNQELLS